jgi:hypothetical protein
VKVGIAPTCTVERGNSVAGYTVERIVEATHFCYTAVKLFTVAFITGPGIFEEETSVLI